MRLGATLLAKSEPSNRGAVSLDILAGQIRQQPAPLPHKFEKPSPGVKVVFVLAQVVGKSADSLGQESNLNLGRTSIIGMRAKFGDDRRFLLGLQRHT